MSLGVGGDGAFDPAAADGIERNHSDVQPTTGPWEMLRKPRSGEDVLGNPGSPRASITSEAPPALRLNSGRL